MSQNFPRLLVAAEFPPNASGGGGTIVRQMLKGWPVEKLFWWSCLPEGDRRFGQQVAVHRVAAIPRRLYPLRRLVRQKAWLMDNLWVPRATRHLRRTLAELKPEVVWSIPHAWSIPPLARVLPAAGIGFHVSVHDYPDVKSMVDSLGAGRCRQWLAGMEQLYARATTRDGIADPMIADLRARTGRDANGAGHAGLEKADFEFLQSRPADTGDRIRIAYTGTISCEEDFAKFVQALDNVRPKFTKKVSLEIFSSHSYEGSPWFDKSWMNEHGNLAEPLFSTELKKCSWGFVMMYLAEDDRSHFFSLPTKLVSYLAAGLPVFALGNAESSLIKTVQKYRVGVWAATGEPSVLQAKVWEAFSITNPWERYGSEIQRCAREEFDVARIRQMFHQCFLTNAQRVAVPKV
jgi:hypothetical protein